MRALLAAALLSCAAQAAAQSVTVQTCTGCHGAQGEGNPQSGAPRLAGQPQAYLERQLAAYAAGSRQNAIMSPIAKSIPEDQRSTFAAFFSQLKAPAPKPSASAGASASAISQGRALAQKGNEARQIQACANCHGPDGTGLGPIPYLAGLDAKYLTAALKEWKSGARSTDPSGQMPRIGKSLSDAELPALASYFASLPPPAPRAAAPAPAPDRNAKGDAAGATDRQGTGASGVEPANNGGSQGPGGGEAKEPQQR